ncbi:MAG: DsbE family thiol:disulfide interchange protein [Sphingomonas sp.]|uniref:DsbE family thiol:disulfide interchange protein n=1 Tax=Sphingomonas sp. TaxID=28214 RepID=UPI0012181E06|nr:DsbE family thiol:disulfide interchange protein [Sphingomonas sp.]THD37504.1 MAG: DsbE family thiol:disulfide interchange protein [Sphingomonas sp.]
MKRALLWAPLLTFVLVIGIAAVALLKPADRTVKSALVGKPLPAFALPPIVATKPGLATTSFRDGQPRLVNVFASWCIPCMAEAPQLLELKQAGVRIEGIAIRDTGPAIADFLARNGDPYEAIGSDPESRVQLSLGSSGVPESFVIDGQGKIVLQHIGDIRGDDVPAILDAIRSAQ